MWVTRKPDSARKPALLEQIIDYLLDKPLASVSLRPLARALGVSTFTLVYHFGSRAELVSEIVQAISRRANEVAESLAEGPVTVDSYLAGFETTWAWAVQQKNIRLQRLEFEAAMLEVHEPALHRHTRDLYAQWQSIGRNALRMLGASDDEAEAESRLTVNTFNGLLYDLVVNQDVEQATLAFDRFLGRTRERLELLAARG